MRKRKITYRACIDCQRWTGRGSNRGPHCWPCEQIFFPLQKAAHQAVLAAVSAGTLQQAYLLKCVDCQGDAEIYEHRDYTKPLDVEPVCQKCNQQRGSAPLPKYLLEHIYPIPPEFHGIPQSKRGYYVRYEYA